MTLSSLETLAAAVTFAAAGVAMIVFLLQLTFNRDWLKPIGMGCMGVAITASTATLVARGVLANHVPWSNLWESIVFMVFGTLAVYFLVEVWYKPRHFGVVAAPLVLVLIGGASLLPPGLKEATPLVPALQSYWIKIHTSAILVSYGAFTMAFAATVAYLVVERRARTQTASAAQHTSPQHTSPALSPAADGPAFEHLNGVTPYAALTGLTPYSVAAGIPQFTAAHATFESDRAAGDASDQLAFYDELSYRLILLGFPLLMFGIVTGGVWANEVWGTYWSWDPKETWALITWFIYAAYLHARIHRQWSGHRAALLSVGGFVSMCICYLGVNFLSSGLHSYGFLR